MVKTANENNFKKPTTNSFKEPREPEGKPKTLMLMGGKLLRTGFLVSKLFKIQPSSHLLTWCEKRSPCSSFISIAFASLPVKAQAGTRRQCLLFCRALPPNKGLTSVPKKCGRNQQWKVLLLAGR